MFSVSGSGTVSFEVFKGKHNILILAFRKLWANFTVIVPLISGFYLVFKIILAVLIFNFLVTLYVNNKN
jgi:hypothetical protein